MRGSGFAEWTRRFEEERERRAALGDPDWRRNATEHPAVWASVQRFQVGEDGDGTSLLAKADRAGDPDYARAARLFVAEEQNHARLLARLLASAGIPTLAGHWSDAVFVRLRRLLGLRLELLVLMVAELVALRYYRALRDGTADPLTSQVAARILADEERHIPFHCARLHASFARLPRLLRRPLLSLWRLLLLAATLFVSLDHGPALRHLGVGRARFAADVLGTSGDVIAVILSPEANGPHGPAQGDAGGADSRLTPASGKPAA
ncbi:ferritin-like domain-containing protein [Streptomyces sp. NPDC059597]|uniref:ferritin-like domain-containing protein n=1 Tax=Streptomyces sp. NPDC059597 TaxID=3346879 RepID=UPI0036A3D4C5